MFASLRELLTSVPADDKLNNIDSIGSLGVMILNVALGISFSVSIIMLAFGAFRYIVSSGDPKLIEKAYHTMFWSLLAGLITLLSIVLKNVIVDAFGVAITDVVSDKPSF